MDSLKFCAKYPFLSSAKRYVESLGLTLSEIVEHPVYSASVEAGRSRVIDALNNKLEAKVGEGIELEVSVLSYPVARVIANLTENKTVVRRYAKGEAERAYEFFRKEDASVLADIKTDLDFPAKNGWMDFRSYLKLSAEPARFDPRWRLSNRSLRDGVVELGGLDELALLREAVRLRITEPVDVKNAPKKLKTIATKIKSSTGFAERKMTAKELEGVEFPPCINHMLSLLESGEASHNIMFTLGTYFTNLGLSIDEVLDFFRRHPSFSEDKARYQLEFIAGEKGGTKYSCPTCTKIKSYGLCEWDCGIKHPLQYKKKD